jgi:hypothetical protein
VAQSAAPVARNQRQIGGVVRVDRLALRLQTVTEIARQIHGM